MKCRILVWLRNVNFSRGFVASLGYFIRYTFGFKAYSYDFFVCYKFYHIFICQGRIHQILFIDIVIWKGHHNLDWLRERKRWVFKASDPLDTNSED